MRSDEPRSREAVLSGVTLWSSEVGPYLWHDFDADRLRAEIAAVAATGLRCLRVMLPWDAFMPTPTRVPDARLRQFELLLELAATHGLVVTPTISAQSWGDCIPLPAYAIDVSHTRRGVRVITDGVLQPGAPRDQHTDSLLLETQIRWLQGLLTGFAGHPALQVWDLGHNPAATMRPRRIQQQVAWCAQLAELVHEHGERCMLTLDTADLITARGVRPALLAPHLDAIGLVLQSDASDVLADATGGDRVLFLCELMNTLSGGDVPLVIHLGAPLPDAQDAPRLGEDGAAAAVQAGAIAVQALWWAETGPRTEAVPPFDHFPDLALRGLVDLHGERTEFGAALISQMTRDVERRDQRRWPGRLDADDYYLNLPESLMDLHRSWKAAFGDRPAMLD